MPYRARLAGAAALSLILAGCGGAGQTANEPVAAMVNGAPITLGDLKAEQSLQSAGQDATLQRLIDRRLLAQAAKARKTGKANPNAAEIARAAEAVLADAELKRLPPPPAPTAAEIAAFVAAHPETFRDRKMLLIDQIELRKDAKPATGGKIESLDAFQALLDRNGTTYRRSVVVIDSGAASATVVSQVLALPPHAVFEIANGDTLVESDLILARPNPRTGALANDFAGSILLNQAQQAVVRKHLAALRDAAKGRITYANGYQPLPAP